MSFFYGLKDVNTTTNGTPNGTIPDAFNMTVLPGHGFKYAPATATILVELVSIAALIVLFIVVWISSQPEPPRYILADKEAFNDWKKLWRPTRHAVHANWTFILHLLLDMAIRICIELRLPVPYAVTAVEVPSKVFLMIADINLAHNIASPLCTLMLRLGSGRWWDFIYAPVLIICAIFWFLLFVAERSGNTYMRYRRGFRWNQPDTTYSAALGLAYASNTLLYAITATFAALKLALLNVSNKKRIDYDADFKPCGKLPSLTLYVLTPAFLIRAASVFVFVFHFQWGKRPQNPDLELPRTLLDCVPAVIINITLAIIRRSDRKLKDEWDQQQSLAARPVYFTGTKFDGPMTGPGYHIIETELQPQGNYR